MTIPWHIVEREAKDRIERLRDTLEAASGEDIVRIQASIKAWRGVLSLPDELATTPENLGPSGYGT